MLLATFSSLLMSVLKVGLTRSRCICMLRDAFDKNGKRVSLTS